MVIQYLGNGYDLYNMFGGLKIKKEAGKNHVT